MPSTKLKTVCSSLLFASICFGTSSAFATATDAADKIQEYYMQFAGDRCQAGKDMANAEWGNCMFSAQEYSVKELEQTFKDILQHIDSINLEELGLSLTTTKQSWKDMLKKSQSYWEKYRDLECNEAEVIMMGSATGAGNASMGCHMEKNFYRIKELRGSSGIDNPQ